MKKILAGKVLSFPSIAFNSDYFWFLLLGSNGSASISVDAQHTTLSSYSAHGLDQHQQQGMNGGSVGGGLAGGSESRNSEGGGGGGNTANSGGGGGNTSQTPSCRALAGSLASFDTGSGINTEGKTGFERRAGRDATYLCFSLFQVCHFWRRMR